MNFKELVGRAATYIKIHYKTTSWKNVLSFLFFLLVAFGFWMSMFLKRTDISSTVKFPILLTNVPNNVSFDNDIPTHLEAIIISSGSDVFKYSKSFKTQDTIKIDVERKINKKGENIIREGQITELIKSKLPTSAHLERFFPSVIDISYSKLEEKEIEVKLNNNNDISPATSYIISDSITITPRFIKAHASREILETISEVNIEHFRLNNLKRDVTETYGLKPIKGVKFSPEEVEVHVKVEEYTERSIETIIRCSNAPNEVDVKFFPAKVKVTFIAMLSEFSKIKEEDFRIEVDYNTLLNSEDGKIEISLTRTSSFAKRISISPQMAEFLLEKKN